MAKRNLIFLDFDGVLNSERSVLAYGKTGWREAGLDPIAVLLMKKLSECAPAEIVISSTWRDHFNVEELKQILADKGWPDCPITGITPNLHRDDGAWTYGGSSKSFRGNEVGHFLARFVQQGGELGNWVCIDDSRDFHVNETSIGGFFSNQPVVFTDDLIGFDYKTFWQALCILNPQHSLVTQLQYNATK